MSKLQRFGLVAAAAALLVPGCVINDSDDDDANTTAADAESGDESGESGDTETRTISWDFDGLEDLGPDAVYEGWIIVDGAAISTGRFSVDDAGAPDLNEFDVAAADADAAATFVLTIEPAQGDDPAPSEIHLLAGDFDGGGADLTVGHAAALATDFADAGGTFILDTPTSMDVADDYLQGIWWLDPTAGPGPALDLPALPAGWAYEGWVVGADGPISTGRFLTASEADSDGAGPDAGRDPAPPFPGQDFVDPALSMIGLTAVISVEPEPDNAAAPFTLKPLVFAEMGDVPPPDGQAMTNNAAASNPTGTASIQ